MNQGDESLNLNMDIIQSTFIKNTADQGGAVWINRGVQSITVDGAKVKENSARIQAGGIGIRNVPQCVIKDVIATENRAGTYGGALSLEVSQVFALCMIMINCAQARFCMKYCLAP